MDSKESDSNTESLPVSREDTTKRTDIARMGAGNEVESDGVTFTGDPGGRLDRRTMLQASAGVGATQLLPLISARSTAESDPPTLVQGFFKVRENGRITFALVARSDLSDEQKDAVINALTTSAGSIVRNDDEELGFFDRFGISSDRLNEMAGDAELTDRQRELLTNEGAAQSLPWPESRTVRGRIKGGVALPEKWNRFAGLRTVCPAVRYDGPKNDEDKRFAVQFQDGFVYQFPFHGEPYRSARYQIQSGVVEKIGTDGNTLFKPDFDGTRGGGDSRLIPKLPHRAHPLFVTIRSLAFRRAILLNVVAGRIARYDDVYTDRILMATGDALLKTIGTLAPVPPDPDDNDGDGTGEFTPEEITMSVVAGGLTIAGTAASGVGGALLLVAGTAIALNDAISAVSHWGNTVQEAADKLENLELLPLQVDGNCDVGNPNPQCCENVKNPLLTNTCGTGKAGQTTPLALGELSRFQAREVTRALATGESGRWNLHQEGYVDINDESANQVDRILNDIDEAKPEDLKGAKELLRQVNGLLQSEKEILEEIARGFSGPTATITIPDADVIVAGETVTLKAEAAASPLVDAGVDTYEWTVDPSIVDAPTVTGTPLEIAFPDSGQYEVTLTVADTEGRTKQITREVNVVPRSETDWRTAGQDLGHTQFAQAATPPKQSPDIAWTSTVEGKLTTRPVVADGTAYVGGTGSDGGGVLVAFDAAGGNDRWRVTTQRPVNANPAVSGETVYVGTAGDGRGTLYAFDAFSGDEAWSIDIGPISAHITATETTVYVRVKDQIVSLTASDGAVRWTQRPRGGSGRRPPKIYGGPVVAGDTVYASVSGQFEGDFTPNDDPGVLAMAAEDGARRWRYDFGGGLGLLYGFPQGSPVVSDGEVYIGSDFNQLYRINTSDGSAQWVAGDPERVADAISNMDPQTIAVANGRVYAAGGRDLVCLDSADGSNRWRQTVGEGITDHLVVANDTVYVPSNAGRVIAFRADNGHERWSRELEDGIAWISAAGDLLLVTTEEGDLSALGGIAAPFEEPLPGTLSNKPPLDPNDDGKYEDINGDGTVNFDDAITLAFADLEQLNSQLNQRQIAALDFDGDGKLTFADAIALAFRGLFST